MISWEKFEYYIGEIQRKDKQISAISKLLGDENKLSEMAAITDAIEMLKDLCNDTDGLIDHWIWELNYGELWEGDACGPHTALDLYNTLVFQDGKARTVFAVQSELPDCPLFELTYDPIARSYHMSMETCLGFTNADGAANYVHRIRREFAVWMRSHNYSLNHPISLGSLFDNRSGMGAFYTSIEEAFAVFDALALAYIGHRNTESGGD